MRLAPIPAFLVLLPMMALAVSGCERTPRADPVPHLEAVIAARSGPDVEFSRITDIGVDAKGHLYVGDGLRRILVLDERGALVRQFGRMGGGPGEFQSIGTVHLLAGDSLFVYDGVAQRATVYAPGTDRIAYTTRFPEPGFSFPMNIEPQDDGSLIGHFRRINGDVPIAGQRRNDVIRILNRDGSIRLDTVITVPEPDMVEVRTEGGQGFFFPLFARQALVRWDLKGRIYSLWTDSTHVRIHDVAGRQRGGFTVRLGTRRLPITTAYIDSVSEQNASEHISVRALSQAFRSQWKTWPLVEDMLVDDQSRIWIQPVTRTADSRWLAFNTDGKQVATLRLPQGVRPRLIQANRMYAVSRDSLDVETVVVYRLAPSSTRTPDQP